MRKVIYIILLIGLLAFFSGVCLCFSAELPPLPQDVPIHQHHKATAVEKRGAELLIAPKAVVPIKPNIELPPATNVFHFAVTARNPYGTSDYSSEVTATNAQPTLAWNPVTGCGVTNYAISRGRQAGTYTATFNAGTNTLLAIPLAAPALTNLVITADPQWATNLSGPWQEVTNWASITVTNPTGNRYYRIGITRTNQ